MATGCESDDNANCNDGRLWRRFTEVHLPSTTLADTDTDTDTDAVAVAISVTVAITVTVADTVTDTNNRHKGNTHANDRY